MENNNEINKIIAKNLTQYRKAAGLTQAELAEKINYSDKSVSKWESGNGVPDVYTLVQIAKLYGLTLNDFVGEESPRKQEKKTKSFHVWIMLLSSGIVWLVATCIFVLLKLFMPSGEWWMSFVFAVMANAIVLIVFSGVWKYRILNFTSVSLLVWTAITCTYLTTKFIADWRGVDISALWLLFLLGVPLQVLECMWAYFRARRRKVKQAMKRAAEDAAEPALQTEKGKEKESK